MVILELIHALEPRLGSGNALEEGRFYYIKTSREGSSLSYKFGDSG